MEQISFDDSPTKPKTPLTLRTPDAEKGATAMDLMDRFDTEMDREAEDRIQQMTQQMKELHTTCRNMEKTLRKQGSLLEEKDQEIKNLRRSSISFQSRQERPNHKQRFSTHTPNPGAGSGYNRPAPQNYGRQDFRQPPPYQNVRLQGVGQSPMLQEASWQFNVPPPRPQETRRQDNRTPTQQNYAINQPRSPYTPNLHFNNHQGRNQMKLKVYYGNTNWEAYYKQFQVFAYRQGWWPDEQKENLFLNLSGVAVDYYYSMCMDVDDIDAIAETMNWRFGKKELPTTLRSTFENMKQIVDESLDEWAERVRSTALGAFMGLPV